MDENIGKVEKKKSDPLGKYLGMEREEGGQEGGAFVAVTWWATRHETPSPNTHFRVYQG